MDALVIGSPAGLAAAVAAALGRNGRTTLLAVEADAADAERAAWVLAEAGEPPLVVVCGPAPHTAAARLLGPGRHVLALEERRLATLASAARQRLPRADARALARAAHRCAGTASTVELGRAGRRWSELRGRPGPLTADRTAALVLRRYLVPTTAPASSPAPAATGEPPR
jgi:hypothetical protein